MMAQNRTATLIVAKWLFLVISLFAVRVNGIQVPLQMNNTPNRVSTNMSVAQAPQLSTSERNRRLIPYMAFYLPAAELPINQQYAIQRHKLPSLLSTAMSDVGGTDGGASVGPVPPPSHIPIPSSYIPPTQNKQQHQMRMTSADTVDGTPAADLSQRYQPGAGEMYQQISYQGAGTGSNRDVGQLKKMPSLHLLPPGALVSSSGNGVQPGSNRKKTVQHFPPTQIPPTPNNLQYATPEAHYQQHHPARQAHQQYEFHPSSSLASPSGVPYRQRGKQSNLNLTPFTSSNTLPGHFIPIIYTPVSSSNEGSGGGSSTSTVSEHGTDSNTSKRVNYKVAGSPSHPNAHAQPQLAAPSVNNEHEYENDEHNVSPAVQYIASVEAGPTANAAVAASGQYHPSSPIYQVINDVSQSDEQLQRHHHQQQHLKHQQQSQQTQQLQPEGTSQYKPKRPQFQPPLVKNFFNEQNEQHSQQQEHPYLTPQEKYVLYLQQRIRYNKQHHQLQQQQLQEQQYSQPVYQKHPHNPHQQHQEQQHYREHQKRIKESGREQLIKQHEQQYRLKHQQQQQQIFIIGSTTAPVDAIGPLELQPTRHHTQTPSSTQHTPTDAPSHPKPEQTDDDQSYNNNYPQHSPIGHAVYARPELPVPANHQPQSKPLQQVVHVPLRTVVSDSSILKQQQHGEIERTPQHNFAPKLGPSTPQYVDYIIEEPKQSLDEEVAQQYYQQQQVQPTHQPTRPQNIPSNVNAATPRPFQKASINEDGPQAAYILISTAAPVQQIQMNGAENFGSTIRPAYQATPTLRLHPITENGHDKYPTRRPVTLITPTPHPHSTPEVTPKYVFFSTKPQFGKLLPHPPTQLHQGNADEASSSQDTGQRVANTPSLPLQSLAYTPKPTQQPQHHEYIEDPSLKGQESKEKFTPHQSLPSPAVVQTLSDPNQLPDIRTSSLTEILHKLQASNHLPQTLTPENIDNSIKTLITILNNLKETQKIVADPPQHHEPEQNSQSSIDYDYNGAVKNTNDDGDESDDQGGSQDIGLISSSADGPNKHPGPSTGRPGIDYPNYAEIPNTSFDCNEQRYKGFFGDPETNCQVWHYCDLNGGKASFLCPNGTIFSQIALTCDWWFNVKCSTTAQLYVLNERLYKYILPFNPKFPEDYSGPIVDKYLAMKFQEMEEKMRVEKKHHPATPPTSDEDVEVDTNQMVDVEEQESTTSIERATTTTTSTTTTAKTTNMQQQKPRDGNKKHDSFNSHVNEQSSERNLLIDDEVDDIAERGSYDTYESSTESPAGIAAAQHNSPVTEPAVIYPLSIKPIVVVSSTIGPNEYENSPLSNDEIEAQRIHKSIGTPNNKHNAKSNDNNGQVTQTQQQSDKRPTRIPITKISVEKVEVIEIKPDGTSGHLTPLFDTNVLKRK